MSVQLDDRRTNIEWRHGAIAAPTAPAAAETPAEPETTAEEDAEILASTIHDADAVEADELSAPPPCDEEHQTAD